jgi:Ca-activated chloride channel family protein
MKRIALAIAAWLLVSPAAADDNAVAYRLYEQGRYAEAAEIFTDPGWKGVAMYKSDQYWRAAEAFVRADDAVSIYNLGNCYARLGYYELALQAYLGALARDPGLADAAANAGIMRKLIADRDDGGQQGLQPQARKIDEVQAEPDDKGKSGEQGDERGKAEEQRASEDRERTRASSEEQAQTQTAEGRSGDGAERQQDEGVAGRNDISGAQGEQDQAENASGGSEGDAAPQPDQAAGQRTRLEIEQATEQWLNRIRDEPAKFLKARIALEARRRVASGNLPPAGGDTW